MKILLKAFLCLEYLNIIRELCIFIQALKKLEGFTNLIWEYLVAQYLLQMLNNALKGLNIKPSSENQINTNQAHEEYLEWGNMPLEAPNSGVDLTSAFRSLRENLEPNTIITNGAGNYAVWGHRLFRFSQFRTQLAQFLDLWVMVFQLQLLQN